METMYTEAVNYHIFSVIGFVVMITALYLFTQLAKELEIYKRRIRMWMPVYIISLTTTIFTGILMMAAKHLAFDLANNIMIALSFFIIFLEIKRHKILKKMSSNDMQQLNIIKLIYSMELLSTFAVVYMMKADML